jgi:hypothetical protein
MHRMKAETMGEEIDYLKQHYMNEIEGLRHEINQLNSPEQFYNEEELSGVENRCQPMSNNSILGGA